MKKIKIKKLPKINLKPISLIAAAILMGVGGTGFAASQSGHDHHAGHDKHAGHGSHQQMDHSEMKHLPTIAMQADDPHAHHKAMMQKDSDPHAHHKHQMNKMDLSAIKLDIPEGMSMENQFGEQVDLLKDVIGDRIAVIDFVYTTCTTVCPVVSSIFTQVQDAMGNKMEKEIALITITVDPARDTSHRLMSYSKKYSPGKNWSWLTGEKKMVDKVNTLLGAYTPLYEDHPAMVLVGDAQSSDWYRYIGFPPPGDISKKVNELLEQRNS